MKIIIVQFIFLIIEFFQLFFEVAHQQVSQHSLLQSLVITWVYRNQYHSFPKES